MLPVSNQDPCRLRPGASLNLCHKYENPAQNIVVPDAPAQCLIMNCRSAPYGSQSWVTGACSICHPERAPSVILSSEAVSQSSFWIRFRGVVLSVTVISVQSVPCLTDSFIIRMTSGSSIKQNTASFSPGQPRDQSRDAD
jgi:hypothetical protein